MISESVSSILARQEDNQKAAAGSGTNIVDKDGFLKLLMTQMQHQDPFSPMENDQMMAQMAQFSSLEQMQSMNANLASSLQWDLLFNQTINNTMATSLIGREVEALGNDVVLGKSGPASMKYELGSFASSVSVEVRNAEDEVIYSEQLGPHDSGSYEWSWNGNDFTGARIPAGSYQVRVVAEDSAGGAVAVNTYRLGQVDGVEYADGSAFLMVNGQRVPLGDIQRISKAN
jgi:flagellar basal-body rod modification protein FlgD